MNDVELHIKRFSDLSLDELYELLRIRSEVFVMEQNCICQDIDGDDQDSIHIWLTVDEKIVALCRVCPAGTHLPQISIGRVITTIRGKGYGKQMMFHAISVAAETLGADCIILEAQEYAIGFYESVGFRLASGPFILDGITHVKMEWRADRG